jgi:hypothetical protein
MSDGKMVTCANCGNERPEGTRFCGNCGTPFPQRDQAASPAGSPPTTSSTRRRRLAWIAVGAAVVMLAAGGAVAAVLSITGEDGPSQAEVAETLSELTTPTESDAFGYTTDETTDDGFPDAEQAYPSTDCSGLVDAVIELGGIDSYEGSDYLSARDFLDDYADRAPEEIRDSVRTLRDFLDEFASAAEAVGLEPGEAPLPDQVDQMTAALDLSSDEQEAIARSYETVTTWSGNEC